MQETSSVEKFPSEFDTAASPRKAVPPSRNVHKPPRTTSEPLRFSKESSLRASSNYVSASRLPLINENEVQGQENAIVESPVKLTPILGSPSPSPRSELSEGEMSNDSQEDAACMNWRRFKRKSTLPLPPNTVIYCSYTENLRKTVSRLIGREVNFCTEVRSPDKDKKQTQTQLGRPALLNGGEMQQPQAYHKIFKKLFITQGALSNSREFKLVARDVLHPRHTAQWWSQNREVLSRHFTLLD